MWRYYENIFGGTCMINAISVFVKEYYSPFRTFRRKCTNTNCKNKIIIAFVWNLWYIAIKHYISKFLCGTCRVWYSIFYSEISMLESQKQKQRGFAKSMKSEAWKFSPLKVIRIFLREDRPNTSLHLLIGKWDWCSRTRCVTGSQIQSQITMTLWGHFCQTM